MGFTERYDSFPSLEALTAIEGTAIIDEAPAGAINGVSQGVAGLVGEFADVSLGVKVDASGVVTTSPQPTEMFGPQDQLDKLGGFDETIGEFGGDMGNGFVELSNKAFSRLVVVPINIASSRGARIWRKLATNVSATVASPVVPVQGVAVPAGREFKSGNNRVRTAKRIQFGGLPEYKSGTDGAVTAAGSAAATQSIISAGGGFTTVLRPDGTIGVQVGDILVLGVIGGAAGLGANADTYRVNTVTDDTQLLLEKMGGSTFDWTTATNLPWRIYTADTADTGGLTDITAAGGYLIPMRPLDATIASATTVSPTVAPPALTATSADPLSGLQMKTDPSVGLIYTADVQAPNAATNAALEALYATAIDALLPDDLPEREVNIAWTARLGVDGIIRAKLVNHVLTQKATGIGRMALTAPPLETTSLSTILGDAAPGVGATRAEEQVMNWPGVQIFVKEAVGLNVKGADGLLYKNGIVDVPSTGFAAAILSQLAPERDPGQASDPVKTIMSTALAIQRGVSGLDKGAYTQLRAKGVMAPRKDRRTGMIFQSGVTTSLIPGQKDINRRRFSFFIEDSIDDFLQPFAKEPMSEGLKDRIVSAIHDFFDSLLAPTPRIVRYLVDPKGSNTKQLTEAGVFVVRYAVQMIPIAKKIVQQASVSVFDITQEASIGNGSVQISQIAA